AFLLCEIAIRLRVCLSHVRKTWAEALIIRTSERILPLQVDVVTDQNQRALLIAEIDTSSGVGENHGTNSHAAKHAHGKGDFLRGVTLIKMHAPLHCGDHDVTSFADYHLTSVADSSRTWKCRNLGVRDAQSFAERVGESAQA